MNAKQEDNITMCNAVIQHVEDNSVIAATVVAFQTAFDEFKAIITQVLDLEALIAQRITAYAADKATLKKLLCERAAEIAALIFSYADAQGNTLLRSQSDYPISSLMLLRDDQLAPVCQNIEDLGTANLAAMADYGLTHTQLLALHVAINNYTASTAKPRTAVSLRKVHIANQAALIKQANALLKNRLDKMVTAFKAAAPDFVSGYMSNRIIVDSGSTATQLRGFVTSEADGTPIKGATVTAVEAGKSAVTNSAGKYIIKPVPPGDYTITVSAPGYTIHTNPSVNAKLGTVNTLDVGLTT